ncbi:MAG: hypothetical protein EBT03_10160 [Betaproteobacteria bacterium]|nr:hypothetical protein [Betaproteobacteria bacterium]
MVAMGDSSGTALAAGRFAGSEPLGFEAGDSNWYRFVANGPLGATDPFGLKYGISFGPCCSKDRKATLIQAWEDAISAGEKWVADLDRFLSRNGKGGANWLLIHGAQEFLRYRMFFETPVGGVGTPHLGTRNTITVDDLLIIDKTVRITVEKMKTGPLKVYCKGPYGCSGSNFAYHYPGGLGHGESLVFCEKYFGVTERRGLAALAFHEATHIFGGTVDIDYMPARPAAFTAAAVGGRVMVPTYESGKVLGTASLIVNASTYENFLWKYFL